MQLPHLVTLYTDVKSLPASHQRKIIRVVPQENREQQRGRTLVRIIKQLLKLMSASTPESAASHNFSRVFQSLVMVNNVKCIVVRVLRLTSI